MRMKIFLATMAVVGFVLADSSAANAAFSVSSRLTVGQVNKLHDDDAELEFTPDGMGGYVLAGAGHVTGVGDILVTTFHINSVGIQTNDPKSFFDGVTNNQLTGVSVIKVNSVVTNGTNTFSDGSQQYKFGFTAATTSDWTSLGLGLSAPNTNGTIIQMYNNSNNNYTKTSGSFTTDFASATGGQLMYELGFTGATDGTTGGIAADTAATSGEGWRAIAPQTSGGLGTIGDTEATFQGAVTVLDSGPGAAGIQLGLVGNNYGSGAKGQFTAGAYTPKTGNQVKGFEFEGTLASGSTDFPIASNSNGFINPATVVPEPSSLVLSMIATGGLAGLSMLRRRFLRRA